MAPNRTILVAEDEPLMRKTICDLATKLGLIVVEAMDGESAFDMFIKSQPDLVLLDAKMPKLDGFATCKKIRTTDWGANVPVIMVTCLADSDSVKRAAAVGATDYVTKPVNWASLRRLLERHLNQEAVAEAGADSGADSGADAGADSGE